MAIEMMESGVRVNAVAPGTIFSQSARDNYAFDVFFADSRKEKYDLFTIKYLTRN